MKPCEWCSSTPARRNARCMSRIRSRCDIQTARPVFSKRHPMHRSALPSEGSLRRSRCRPSGSRASFRSGRHARARAADSPCSRRRRSCPTAAARPDRSRASYRNPGRRRRRRRRPATSDSQKYSSQPSSRAPRLHGLLQHRGRGGGRRAPERPRGGSGRPRASYTRCCFDGILSLSRRCPAEILLRRDLLLPLEGRERLRDKEGRCHMDAHAALLVAGVLAATSSGSYRPALRCRARPRPFPSGRPSMK